MGYRIGFDIGSTTIKAVVLDENNQICYKSYERHKAQVRQKALDKLVELKKYTKEPFKFAISGSGALGLCEQGELPFVQEVFASATWWRRRKNSFLSRKCRTKNEFNLCRRYRSFY